MTAQNLGLTIGLLFDSPNTLYVSDSSQNRIQKFLLTNPNGQTVAGLSSGVASSVAGGLRYASDIALDSQGNLYVADSQNNRIQVWRVNATTGQTIFGNGKSKKSPDLHTILHNFQVLLVLH